MTYVPHNWKDGELLRAEDLNHLEQGVLNEQIGPPGPEGQQGPPGADGTPGKDGEDGKDGATPHIGSNGNWWIGEQDTGVSATGPKGDAGQQGPQGEPGGVLSFNGRTGAIEPQAGDYTAVMVSARPDNWTPTAKEVGARPENWIPTASETGAIPVGPVKEIRLMTQDAYEALSSKVSTTLYLISE